MKHSRTALFIIFLLSLFPLAGQAKQATTANELRKLADKKYYAEMYPEALDLYIKALDKAKKEGNTYQYIACTGYIGNIYDAFGDNNSCIHYYMQGLEAAKRCGNLRIQLNLLTNIVTCYTRMGNIKQAKHYFQLLQEKSRHSANDTTHYYILYNKARILGAERQYQKAIRQHRAALAFAQKHHLGSSIYLLYQLSEIANLYIRCGMAHEALAVSDSCINMANELNSGELKVNAYKVKADAYAMLNKDREAQRYRELYFSLNDSVYNIHKFYKARYNLMEYENQEHQKQLTMLNERIKQQIYVIIAVVLFLSLMSLLAYIIYSKNKKLKVAQRLLIQKNNDMEQREAQNQLLLKQYLLQLNAAESANKSTANCIPCSASTPTDRNACTADTKPTNIVKNNTPVLTDDNEKRLLNRINNVINDITFIANPDFSLQILAEAVESNVNYVSHVINNTYKKNFKTLLNERRICEACHKLADPKRYSNYTMQAIYEEAGYRNATSFIRAFKKIYGMTPSEYQRLVQAQQAETIVPADNEEDN